MDVEKRSTTENELEIFLRLSVYQLTFDQMNIVEYACLQSDYSPTFDKASPNAKRLINEDFYFSTIDETAPFGNDDGADTNGQLGLSKI